jgi:tetratricopeptide (TPR) repeat protein
MFSGILVAMLAVSVLQTPTAATPAIPSVAAADFPPVVREQVQSAYEAALAHPRDAGAVGRLGMLLELYSKREPAALCYERASRLEPKTFRWKYYLGSLQSAQGKRAEATETLRAALRLSPGYLPAMFRLADNLLGSGEWDEGAKIYETAAKDHPEAAEAWYGLGRVRAARGDPAGAAALYRKACDLFPSYGAAHYGLAMAYRKSGEKEKADEHLKIHAANRNLVPPVPDPLRDELRTLDKGAPSLLQRGIDFQQAGRVEDAIREHEKALEIDPDYVLAHSNLIILYGRTHQAAKAEEHFRAAIRLNPGSAEACYNYGVLLLNDGRAVDAEEMFRKVLESNPFHPQALHNMGVLREQQGKLEEAMQFYLRAVDRQPGFPVAQFHIGRLLVNQKKYDEAIAHFLQALGTEDEITPSCLYALCATYARAGNRDEALRYGRMAREKAASLGQAALLRSIEKDLKALETPPR